MRADQFSISEMAYPSTLLMEFPELEQVFQSPQEASCKTTE